MNTVMSNVTGSTYRGAIKPLLFKLQPDTVHSGMLRASRAVQWAAPLRGLLAASYAYQDQRLAQDLLGAHFKNPIGLSAGFDKNIELAPILKALGFGFMEGGTITYRQTIGNPRPWFYRLPHSKSLVVHVGLANQGCDKILQRVAGYNSKVFDDFPLNISVAQTNSSAVQGEAAAIKECMRALKAAAASRAPLLTINISCPNTYNGEPFTTPKALERLLAAVDELQLTKPVFLKMPNQLSWTEFEKLLDVAAKHETIAGVTVSNLAKDRSLVSPKDTLPETVKGGLSGKPTWEQSNELIRRTYKAYGDRFVIVGVGGVFSAEDAYTKIRLGASLVALITGMIFNGPQLIGQINQGLVKLLERDGLDSITDAIGLDA